MVVARSHMRFVDRELAREGLERLVRTAFVPKVAERDVGRENVRIARLDAEVFKRANHVDVQVLEPRCVEQRDEGRRRAAAFCGTVEVPPALNLRVDRLGALADSSQRLERSVYLLRRMVVQRFLRVHEGDVVDVFMLRHIGDDALLNVTQVCGNVLRHPYVDKEPPRIQLDLSAFLAFDEHTAQCLGQGERSHGEIIADPAYPYDVPSKGV